MTETIIDTEIIYDNSPNNTEEESIDNKIEKYSLLMRYASYYYKTNKKEIYLKDNPFPIKNIFIIREMEDLSDKIDTLTLAQMVMVSEGKDISCNTDIHRAKEYMVFMIENRVGKFFSPLLEFFKKDKNVEKMIRKNIIPNISHHFL